MIAPDQFTVTGFPANQYMVFIRPSEPIEHRIKKLKTHLKQEFELQHTQLMGGYILLSRFSQQEGLERNLLDRLRLISMEAAPFRVQFSGFFSIPGQSVGIRIANPGQISLLTKSLKQEQRLMKTPSSKPYFNSYPAVCLASRLDATQYKNVWNDLKNRQFNGTCIADNLVVIRKRPTEKQWIIVEQMAFQNLPVSTRQGVLFA
jgi:2'-5' RNA ligase